MTITIATGRTEPGASAAAAKASAAPVAKATVDDHKACNGRTRRSFRETELITGVRGERVARRQRLGDRGGQLGTLDGAPLVVYGFRIQGDESATVETDQGTFTAIKDGAEVEHSEALRSFLEARPSRGWTTTAERSSFVDGTWRYVVAVTNDRVFERIEVVPDKLARDWIDRSGVELDRLVERHTKQMLRSTKWSDVQKKTKRPTEVIWTARPPDP